MTIILSNVNRFKNNQIKKRFIAESVSEKKFKIGEYLAKLQIRM